MYSENIPIPYLSVVKSNYEIIKASDISNDSLTRYYTGCFDDIIRMTNCYQMWVCPTCMGLGKLSYGYGSKPHSCPNCDKRLYLVATFNQRASNVGDVFEYASFYLLRERYNFELQMTGVRTRIYDFELRRDVVIEAKGSPSHILNPDGTRTKLTRPGMTRTDTRKKAFNNAEEWNKRFPAGNFFIITNSLPKDLVSFRSRTITGVYDITKRDQLEQLVTELEKATKTS